jgi:hypothetical protein
MYDQQDNVESPGQSKAHLVGAGASCQESLHEPDMNFGVRACKGCRKNTRHQIAWQCILSLLSERDTISDFSACHFDGVYQHVAKKGAPLYSAQSDF